MANTLHERRRYWVQQLAKDMGREALASKLGYEDTNYLNQVITGHSNLGNRNAVRWSEALGRPGDYLDRAIPADGIGEEMISYEPADGLISPPRMKMLPIISSVQAGNWGDVDDPFEPGMADEYAAVTGNWSEHAFVLTVEGDSMTNHRGGLSIPSGAQVIVEPSDDARNGDIVVAKLEGHEQATVKKLVIDPPNTYLMPLNDQYDKIKVDGECRIVGVVRQFFMVLRR